ncbi:hypothetical protein CFOL_v3_12025 [Cephalotus follicularis]|uniref:Josephin-like protein n=1 Tax=Cephalotus follicularis TaxID=3775 RepID=A0A1Q3BL14_CEPFO|nr:hypothetical protein CFOL_v3_12025 [Cephalotus follicularis]
MSRKASMRVSFSPDTLDKPTIYLKHGGSRSQAGNRSRVTAGIFILRLPRSPRLSPARVLRHLGAKVAGALQFVSMRRSSCKVSSSNLTRSHSLAESTESHRAEAIEDCIQFLNSSSSLQRSNSTPSISC